MPAQQTGIVWTDWSLNAWKGCVKISEGCQHCYAADLADRFDRTPEPWTIEHVDENVVAYDDAPAAAFQKLPDAGRWVFLPSSSDPYLPWVPDDVHTQWLEGIREHNQHCYQVLTKHGAEDHGREIGWWPKHVMLGVSVESPRREYRLEWLRRQEAATKFVSFEPLVECIPDLDLSGIDWAIIGGESLQDSDARRDMASAWARNLVRSCRRQDTAVFFKQHSGPYAEESILLDMQDGQGPRGIRELPDLPEGVAEKHDPYRALQCAECGEGFVHGTDGRTDVPPDPGLCSGCIPEVGVEPGEHSKQATLTGGVSP